ncbi:hypothetical protein BDW68DRAFT_123532 [Aspergillus falconensis]
MTAQSIYPMIRSEVKFSHFPQPSCGIFANEDNWSVVTTLSQLRMKRYRVQGNPAKESPPRRQHGYMNPTNLGLRIGSGTARWRGFRPTLKEENVMVESVVNSSNSGRIDCSNRDGWVEVNGRLTSLLDMAGTESNSICESSLQDSSQQPIRYRGAEGLAEMYRMHRGRVAEGPTNVALLIVMFRWVPHTRPLENMNKRVIMAAGALGEYEWARCERLYMVQLFARILADLDPGSRIAHLTSWSRSSATKQVKYASKQLPTVPFGLHPIERTDNLSYVLNNRGGQQLRVPNMLKDKASRNGSQEPRLETIFSKSFFCVPLRL